VTFQGHCAEFCGLSHSLMRTLVEVRVSEADFEAWAAAQLEPAAWCPRRGHLAVRGL
jgi:heme/copper-type cytochrome/quinol oxidase subunit 2